MLESVITIIAMGDSFSLIPLYRGPYSARSVRSDHFAEKTFAKC